MKKKTLLFALSASHTSFGAMAEIVVPMNLVDEKGIGVVVGQVIISESKYGLVFIFALLS